MHFLLGVRIILLNQFGEITFEVNLVLITCFIGNIWYFFDSFLKDFLIFVDIFQDLFNFIFEVSIGANLN